MSQPGLQCLRSLADPTRLRIMALLEVEELTVSELQAITQMGQSRISTHLANLQEASLIVSRRDGKNTFHKRHPAPSELATQIIEAALLAAREQDEFESDQLNLKHVLAKREDPSTAIFQRIAGRFDRSYGPGRSWQAFGNLLLKILPSVEVADLGSGEGLLSELLAHSCHRVIAVDNSQKIVEFGRSKAEKNGIHNLEFRLGDIETPPIENESIDIAILSQALHHAEHPGLAIQAAYRILRPNGRVTILDLAKHDFEQAKALYGDTWLGFSEGELRQWLEAAGFTHIDIREVAKEAEPPFFTTLLATGLKPEDRI